LLAQLVAKLSQVGARGHGVDANLVDVLLFPLVRRGTVKSVDNGDGGGSILKAHLERHCEQHFTVHGRHSVRGETRGGVALERAGSAFHSAKLNILLSTIVAALTLPSF
jgi:hypothetical protein